MARLVMAGFEAGNTLAYGVDSVGSGSEITTNSPGYLALVTGSPTARNGSYCLKTNWVTGAGGGIFTGRYWEGYGKKAWSHAAKTELWYAFGFHPHPTDQYTPIPQNILFATRDAASNVNVLVSLDGGLLRAYVATAGANTPHDANLTQIGGNVACASDTWHLLEIHVIAATGATGTFELYIDGTLGFSVTSQRTAQTTASMSSFELGYIQTGAATWTNVNVSLSNQSFHAFDDVRVNDTTGSVNNGKPGDGAVLALIPNGVGTTLGGTALTGVPSGPNWQNVDERPASTSEYNAGTVVGTGETYALTDPPPSG